jgi:hypothetical protein
MPDGVMLGILVYEHGVCLVQSRMEPKQAAQVLRDMAEAMETGTPIEVVFDGES